MNGSVPSPGPSASTAFPSAASSTTSAARSARWPEAPTGRGRVIDSIEPSSTVCRIGSGTAAVTSPAPARTAARAARMQAPALPGEPATIRACPKSPLWEPASRAGIRSASSSPISRWRSPPSSSTSSTSRAGMPRSVTTISPTASAAGGKTWATLGAAKVTVRSAFTCRPIGRGSLPAKPLGRSTATQGTGSSLMQFTTRANSPSSGRARPVPNRASTTTSQSAAAPMATRSSFSAPISRIGSSILRQIAS